MIKNGKFEITLQNNKIVRVNENQLTAYKMSHSNKKEGAAIFLITTNYFLVVLWEHFGLNVQLMMRQVFGLRLDTTSLAKCDGLVKQYDSYSFFDTQAVTPLVDELISESTANISQLWTLPSKN